MVISHYAHIKPQSLGTKKVLRLPMEPISGHTGEINVKKVQYLLGFEPTTTKL